MELECGRILRDSYLISIIVPTYNEAKNINELINRVHASLENFKHEIVVVDDDSPDRTWEIVKSRSEKEKWIRLIKRNRLNRGLSKAVIEGFNSAKGELLGVIDADLQHDERIIPELIERTKDVPIAIGSRYIRGGEIGNWGFSRRVKSWVATKIAALFLNVTVSDPMTGFFVMRKDVYENIKDKINPQGFKILLEILYHHDSAVAEVPYHFRPRTAGQSKLTSKVISEYLLQVFRLRMNSPIPKGFIKYCIVGTVGVFVDTFSFLLCSKVSLLPAELCGVISSQVAIISNFLFNDRWTFLARKNNTQWIHRFLKYEAACVLGISIKFIVILLAVRVFTLNPFVANSIAIIMVVTMNFILSKLWVWQGKSSS